LEGDGFHHRWFGLREMDAGTVHLYLEGDGRPVLNRTQIASDPTPPYSIVLPWMRSDVAPSYYLGRPCYLGMAKKDDCHSRWWTVDRYSPAVVGSMVAAANQLLEGRPVILIGHSGGGTLAVAMASRIPNVRGLVTVAGNLDVEGWTRLHGYSGLTQPGDIKEMLRDLQDVPQRHYVGARDRNVIPQLTLGLFDAMPPGSLCVVKHWNHRCCFMPSRNTLADLSPSTCKSVGGKVYSAAEVSKGGSR